MKKITQYISVLSAICFLSLTNLDNVQAQCNNGYQYGTEAAPTNTTPATISSCSFQDEYSTITNVVSGQTYEVNSDCGGFITVRSSTPGGTVVNSGNAPLSWTATSNNDHYIHWNTNSACGTATNCCATTITCTSCGGPATCSDGIQNQGELGIDCGGPCATTCPPVIIPNVCASATYTLPAGSFANFYDDGGPGGDCSTDGVAGNFANAGCVTTTTICAAPGEFLIADFSVFSMYNTSSGWDWMVIYEGPTTGGTILFDNRSSGPDNPVGTNCTYDGSSLNICAAGECLTFAFNATSVVNKEGWDALVSSVPVACTPLPVELLNFNGKKQGNTNELAWETATEINNDYFTLEYSPDGKVWKEVQKINGAGSSSTKRTYLTKHRDFENRINYYRLTQVDFNGKKTIFETVSIDNSEERTLLKRVNTMGQEVNENYRGMVILYYSDGTIEKTFL